MQGRLGSARPWCAALAGNRPSRGLEAGSRAAWGARCGGWWKVGGGGGRRTDGGGGALGAAVEADMRSGYAAAARAGK